MPYIKQERRAKLDACIDALAREIFKGDCPDGEVNYVMSSLSVKVLIANANHIRYNDVKNVMGNYFCAAMEFYRRIGSRVENNAINRNGDLREYV